MSQRITKPSIRPVLPAKTQISLYNPPSMASLLLYPSLDSLEAKKAHAISEDSDQPAEQADVLPGRTLRIVGFVVRWLVGFVVGIC